MIHLKDFFIYDIYEGTFDLFVYGELKNTYYRKIRGITLNPIKALSNKVEL